MWYPVEQDSHNVGNHLITFHQLSFIRNTLGSNSNTTFQIFYGREVSPLYGRHFCLKILRKWGYPHPPLRKFRKTDPKKCSPTRAMKGVFASNWVKKKYQEGLKMDFKVLKVVILDQK